MIDKGLFHSTDMGGNLEEVVETETCKVLRMKDQSGDGLMTIYRVFDGVYLMYKTHCYSRFVSSSRLFCIDHCREGRNEHRTENDMRYYMEAGDLRLDRRVHHSGDMYFPLSHYHGITVGFFPDYAEKAVHNLEMLDLSHLRERHPMSLSGGQKQRVAVASAILAGKEILIFDEPTSGLDFRHMEQTAALLSSLKGNQTVLIVTHDPELIQRCCDHIVCIENGTVI